MPLDEWQEYALEAAMGERADGRWVSKFVGISAPRQNGKSQIIVARALAGILLFGEKMIIISAHETDTARTVWKRLIDLIEANPSLEARVTGRMDAINREFVSFGKGTDKQTIKLKARQKSGARGFSADCLLLDEAQILGKSAWGSIVPTMSAMPNPQMWLFGTPPTPEDDPFAFTRVRESALAKKPRHAWLEWSASPGDDFNRPETWAKANPSYGVRIDEEACADDRAAMDDDQFALERLGMWLDAGAHQRAIPLAAWNAQAVAAAQVPTGAPTAYSLDMNPERDVTVGVAVPGDGVTHVELAAKDQGVDDTRLLLDWLTERCGRRVPVVIHSTSPAASLAPELRARKVKVLLLSVADTVRACGGFYDAVLEGRLTHFGQPEVDASLAGAAKKPVGDGGGWMWDFKRSTTNPAPIACLTLAHYGATVNTKTRGGSAVFA